MKLSPLERIDLIRARLHRLFKDLEDVSAPAAAFDALAATRKELLRLAEISEPQR